MDNLDISTEIDRILSSNIKDELLRQIPIQLLQTPTVQKKYVRDQVSSAKSKQSFSRQNFQQDLYQKAQQIIKLKQTLQAELSHINQIVQDNQKLTEANLYLSQELKKIKAQWKSFKINVAKDLNEQKQKFLQLQAQFSQTLQLAHQKKQIKKQKMSIFSVFSIKEGDDLPFHNGKQKNKNFQISSQQFVSNFYFKKTFKKSIESQTQFRAKNFEQEMEQLKDKLQKISKENNALKSQIQILKKTQKIDSNPIEKISKQSKNQNKTNVECYSSVFLKSVFSQLENTDQIIRSALFSQQKPFFDQLKETKYFGKMILGNKNGKGLQEYKNCFNYQGNFIRNQRHGIGKLFYKDKLVYMGQWKKGKFYGKGIIFYYMNLNIKKIEGNFKSGALEGHSTITLQSGHKVRAIFNNNKILQNGMLMPSQKSSHKMFLCKSYEGKVKLIKREQFEDKLIFISSTGQTFNL